MACWFIEDARTGITGTGHRRIDVWHAHLDDVGSDTSARCDLIATDVSDDNGAARSDSQLSAVRFADADPFLEAERRLEPRYGRSYIWVDEHWGYGYGRGAERFVSTIERSKRGPPCRPVARGEIKVLWMGRERRREDRCTEPWDVRTYDPRTGIGWPRL